MASGPTAQPARGPTAAREPVAQDGAHPAGKAGAVGPADRPMCRLPSLSFFSFPFLYLLVCLNGLLN
jgi:hypothetical protein